LVHFSSGTFPSVALAFPRHLPTTNQREEKLNPQVNNRHEWASPIYLLEPHRLFEQTSRVAEIWHDSFPESVDVFNEVFEIIQ